MHKSVQDVLNMKKNGEKISVLTSYDYTLASLCDRAGIDILLVGDSAGMVMLGYENTIPVTMDQMCMFTEAVSRARKDSLLVADLPFMSYQINIDDAIRNSGRLIKAGADAVIVGSAFLKLIEKTPQNKLESEIQQFTKSLKKHTVPVKK